MMPLGRALAWLDHAVLVGDGNTPLLRVHTDTRSLEPGDLFVALQGERFDANDLLAEAQARGASARCAGPACRLRRTGRAWRALRWPTPAPRWPQLARGLAQPVRLAADRGDGQQRQDHRSPR